MEGFYINPFNSENQSYLKKLNSFERRIANKLKKETQDSIISCHGQMLNHVKFLNAETKFILKPSIERKY